MAALIIITINHVVVIPLNVVQDILEEEDEDEEAGDVDDDEGEDDAFRLSSILDAILVFDSLFM